MITKVNWGDMDHRHSYKAYYEERLFGFSAIGAMDCTNMRISRWLAFPKDENNVVTKEGYSPWHDFGVVGPISQEAVIKQAPSNWLSGESAVEAIFSKDTRPWHVSDWVELQNFYEKK